MAERDHGTHITLDDFREMSEQEQFAHVFLAVKAITHLEVAAKVADTILERARSVFGAFNLKKHLDLGRKLYEKHS